MASGVGFDGFDGGFGICLLSSTLVLYMTWSVRWPFNAALSFSCHHIRLLSVLYLSIELRERTMW